MGTVDAETCLKAQRRGAPETSINRPYDDGIDIGWVD